jgi:hypothetical protein
MSPDKAATEPAEPWRSFLRELDACLTGEVELRCFGGFVVAQHYGLGRETSDIDFVAAITQSRADDLEHLAGMHSGLYRKYRLYLQHVGIATPPSDYARRLTRMFPNAPWTQPIWRSRSWNAIRSETERTSCGLPVQGCSISRPSEEDTSTKSVPICWGTSRGTTRPWNSG